MLHISRQECQVLRHFPSQACLGLHRGKMPGLVGFKPRSPTKEVQMSINKELFYIVIISFSFD